MYLLAVVSTICFHRILLFLLFRKVSHMHSNDIVHWDIKPDNTLIEYTNSSKESVRRIQIINFGNAKRFENDGTVPRLQTQDVGTPGSK